MLPTTPKKTRHLQKGSSRLARHVSHMGSREESHRSRSSCHLSSETYWPLTTIVINDFRIQHLTLNNDKMKNYAVKNLRKLRQNLCNAIFLVLTFCTPQIEKTRILEQILSSITELSYFQLQHHQQGLHHLNLARLTWHNQSTQLITIATTIAKIMTIINNYTEK